MAIDFIDRPLALAHCAYCRWKASCVGDDMIEVVESLRRILVQHVKDDHPDQDHTGAVQYRSLVTVKP